MRTIISILLLFALATSGAFADNQSEEPENAPKVPENPLLCRSTLQYQAPDFRAIEDRHFMPAFEEGMRQQLAEVKAIAENPEPPTFENTLVALERSGETLTRVSNVFFNIVSTDSNPERLKIEAEIVPRLAAHSDNITLDPKLFERVRKIHSERSSLGLDPESLRLVEIYYEKFVRSGAELSDAQKTAIRAINEEHSKLANQFSQNLVAEARRIAVVVDDVAELDGMGKADIAAAAETAKERGLEGKYLLPITNTTRQPAIVPLNNRSLRQRIWEASAGRAQSGETDNRAIVSRIAKLRADKARVLGYENWAAYILEPQMARMPQAVLSMVGGMVPGIVDNTKKEADAIQDIIRRKGGDFEPQPWDWEYYAEFVRQEQYDMDESQVKPYFEFRRVLRDGVFFAMNRLYGIRFERREDLPGYHPNVEVYEVFDAQGKSIALFYGDYFTRDGKRGGAWMSSFAAQSHLLGQKPLVLNSLNIVKAPAGSPTLLTYDEVTTMFHEMGHAVHGMFSDVRYPSLSGTEVSRDFVECPSTFHEDWAIHPEVVANYARHHETGEAIPQELLAKLIKSRRFNQGFDRLEYIAATLLDMEWHLLNADQPAQEPNAFEKAVLDKYGVVLPAVPPRYRSCYFLHSMGGDYSANYYSYIWSEILAADAFAHMMSQGGLTRENGEAFRRHILSVGNSRPPMDSYRAFRGGEPTTEALFVRLGLK